MSKYNVSVITTTLNSGKTMRLFLDALKWADEVVITEAGSTDDTIKIAKQYKNVKIYHMKGCTYSDGFENSFNKASNDWVLMLGSDEEVLPELAYEISQAVKTADKKGINGFWIPSLVSVIDKWVVDFPSKARIIRLARKSKAKFMPRMVHESMKVEPPYGALQNYYLHHHFHTVSERLGKVDYYSTLDVEQRKMQNIKFSPLRLIYMPVKYFIWHYILLGKASQGVRGLYLSVLKGFYKFLEEMKMFEYEVTKKDIKKSEWRKHDIDS